MAVPKQKKGRGATHTRRSANSKLEASARSVCPQCGAPQAPAPRVSQLRSLQGPRGHRHRVGTPGRLIGAFGAVPLVDGPVFVA